MQKYDALGTNWEAYQHTGDDWPDYANRSKQNERPSQGNPSAFYGQQLKIKGKGQPSVKGGNRGNLFIILKVQQDSRFQRNGDHLRYVATVDLYTAILGGKIEVPTLTGTVKVTVPKESETGKTLRLKGKGMPIYSKPLQFGDLLVKLNVELPKQLTKEEEIFKKSQNLRETQTVNPN
ncbi:DnaJ C-terminal domain-containing protein [Polaribacter sp. ALD11]|uniref:DnaJ C-terminal domain-containing protein n=1 Tax=Polaribacter sp. ALD11 TaxID=2058137 RepID=UPI002676AD61|nr:DnaJ C-terminal domain-containing protein [Polaribacter sp. ALD11]